MKHACQELLSCPVSEQAERFYRSGAVSDIRVSVGFYDQVFTLKEHIQMVRQKLLYLNHESPEKSD